MSTTTNDDLKQRVIEFYEKNDRSKISQVDKILSAFEGDEEGLWNSLNEKYGGTKKQQQPSSNGNGQNPSPMSVRDRLIRFLEHHNPKNLQHVDRILDTYKDNEDQLFVTLVQKYGPEPSASSSSSSSQQQPSSNGNRHPPSMSVRDRLIRFLEHYNPKHVAHVDQVLYAYTNNEDKLFVNLVEKYGPEPPFNVDSSGAPSNIKKVRIIGTKWPPSPSTYCDIDVAKKLRDVIGPLSQDLGVDANFFDQHAVHCAQEGGKPGSEIELDDVLDKVNEKPILWIMKKKTVVVSDVEASKKTLSSSSQQQKSCYYTPPTNLAEIFDSYLPAGSVQSNVASSSLSRQDVFAALCQYSPSADPTELFNAVMSNSNNNEITKDQFISIATPYYRAPAPTRAEFCEIVKTGTIQDVRHAVEVRGYNVKSIENNACEDDKIPHPIKILIARQDNPVDILIYLLNRGADVSGGSLAALEGEKLRRAEERKQNHLLDNEIEILWEEFLDNLPTSKRDNDQKIRRFDMFQAMAAANGDEGRNSSSIRAEDVGERFVSMFLLPGPNGGEFDELFPTKQEKQILREMVRFAAEKAAQDSFHSTGANYDLIDLADMQLFVLHVSSVVDVYSSFFSICGISPAKINYVVDFATFEQEIVPLINAANSSGKTDVVIPPENVKQVFADLLKTKHANSNDNNTNNNHVSIATFCKWYTDQVKFLTPTLEHKSNKTSSSPTSTTTSTTTRPLRPLFVAVSKTNVEACKILLNHGADPLAVGTSEMTPIHQAALMCGGGNTITSSSSSSPELQILKLLLEKVPPNERFGLIKDNQGCTCLHSAVFSGNVEAVKLVLKHLRSVYARTERNDFGKTALEIAVEEEFGDEMIETLKHYGL